MWFGGGHVVWRWACGLEVGMWFGGGHVVWRWACVLEVGGARSSLSLHTVALLRPSITMALATYRMEQSSLKSNPQTIDSGMQQALVVIF